jgi:hypothetical protein
MFNYKVVTRVATLEPNALAEFTEDELAIVLNLEFAKLASKYSSELAQGWQKISHNLQFVENHRIISFLFRQSVNP